MAGWKEILIDMLKLTDEVKDLNKDIDRAQALMLDHEKRLVRLETMVEIAQNQSTKKIQ